MARGVNKVIIVGNLGADPEVRYTSSGTAIAEIRVATSEQWTDKNSGQKQERTEWHRITFFGRLAEIAGEYLRKGRQVYVEGSLQTDSYEKEGVTHYSTKIKGREMQMLGGGAGHERSENRQGRQSSGRQQPPPSQDTSFEDDDIPF